MFRTFRSYAIVPRSTHLLSLAVEFNTPTVQHIRNIEIIRFMKRISALPPDHPSKLLYDKYYNIYDPLLQHSRLFKNNRGTPLWSSLKSLYQIVHNKYTHTHRANPNTLL